MKKFLNLITISTLTTVLPTPLLSNISLIEKVKQDVGISNSNNEYVQLKNIKYFDSYLVLSVACDSKDNVYFGTYAKGAYVLKKGETKPTKINYNKRNC